MLSKEEIKRKLESIYSKIPSFDCKHCHECEGPVLWFEPEEIIIRDYLEKNKMNYVQWTREEFDKNKCPYLKNDRCSIYPVRPVVCRLQGVIEDLPCRYNKEKILPSKELEEIKKEMNDLIREMGAIGRVYGTKKY